MNFRTNSSFEASTGVLEPDWVFTNSVDGTSEPVFLKTSESIPWTEPGSSGKKARLLGLVSFRL